MSFKSKFFAKIVRAVAGFQQTRIPQVIADKKTQETAISTNVSSSSSHIQEKEAQNGDNELVPESSNNMTNLKSRSSRSVTMTNIKSQTEIANRSPKSSDQETGIPTIYMKMLKDNYTEFNEHFKNLEQKKVKTAREIVEHKNLKRP
ncbi:uncharacterized protein LOC119662197 [Teleopsis dalmanni]|uniref:uncharacterized protein LOC119662196 n=1 Tax=Teleopsis dalmanni TaxID=139649 RepID=UPI0018CF2A14|nr:uncharacterized protein LOC119662196 [Teleopsis dalmanni]XP_037927702.1 uncharacterized protein LOC119662197 [Teleopsis dalmanni]